MTGKWTHVAIVALFTAVVLIGLVGVASAGTTEEPETPEEYLTAFQELSDTEAFESYSEFEAIRSQAIQDVQVGEFTTAKERQMAAILDLLERFAEAYDAEQSGSYEEALDIANETRQINDRLFSIEGGEQYALLSEIALDRFYEQTAETLLERAETIDRTPDRLDELTLAATAYNEAGATERFADVQLRADETEQRYRTDREQLNASAATLEGFVGDCAECDSVEAVLTENPLGVFGLYSESQSALAAGDEALGLADQHGLAGVESDLQGSYETAETHQQTVMIASVSAVMGYSAIVGLIVALFTWRLMLWKRDFVASQQGDVVLMGEMLSA